MTIKCPKCHHENPDDTIYCGKCTTPLRPPEDMEVTETIEAPKEDLATGSTFAGRYQIIEELGKGGMGRVYKALDKEVHEKVAIKLIKPEIAADKKTIDRFRNELKFSRKISHKNVCRMYDLNKEEDSYYITMEYVDGEDLKSMIRMMGQLTIKKAISIAEQMCAGLTEAHRLGVVHRDLKPQNVMIDKEGNTRIMDFGIARSIEAKGITDEGIIVGTPEYMAPEQVEGKGIDHRSDIYSIGIILYEMVTGKVPFEGHTPLSIAMKHMTEKPQEPREINDQIPADLSRVILKCVEKKKENRFMKVDEILLDLKNIGLGKPAVEKAKEMAWKNSIAVLPFTDLSPKKDQEYFCDGLAEEIINALNKIKDLRVVARTSAFSFKGKELDIRKIGKQLNVDTILDGSVRKAGNRLRITAQLINIIGDFHLWSEKYDRDMEDIFAIQDDISQAIVSKLKIELIGDERALLTKRYTENLKAYHLYLKGRHFWNKRTKQSLKQSIGYFEQAIKIDPEYALAYTGLADAYNILGSYEMLPPLEAYPKAKEAAMRALEIDDTLAEAYTSLARVKNRFDWDWSGSEEYFKKAIELNSSYPMGHSWYSILLRSLGRFDEALTIINKALELDPLSLPINTTIGSIFYFAQKYDQAIIQCKKALELDPNFTWAHAILASAYLQKFLFEKAIAEFKKAVFLSKASTWYVAELAHAYAVTGDKNKALNSLDKLLEQSKREYVPVAEIAMIYTGLNNKEKAIEWLEKAFIERSDKLVNLNVEPRLGNLRSEPKFKALLKKMGLG